MAKPIQYCKVKKKINENALFSQETYYMRKNKLYRFYSALYYNTVMVDTYTILLFLKGNHFCVIWYTVRPWA